MTNANADLDDLVNEPRETLDVEVKEWLDLAEPDHRAALAKEIIAIANHGGGFVIVGFKELEDGTFRPAQRRPRDLSSWSQDAIQSVLEKYVDPSIQCRVWHRTASGTSERHPVIAVPGGHRVPVRAKAGSPDGKRLVPNRVYIRRAGPSSEEPRATEEWDRFIERLVQNRQAELLDAMRSIMAGVIPTAGAAPEQIRVDQLTSFEKQAIARWTALVDSLPPDTPPRFKHGHYHAGFTIDGDFDRKSLPELNRIIRSEVRNHSGWPPFLTIGRAPYTPRPVDGTIECWMGPDTDNPAHSDFWRISPDGLFFTGEATRKTATIARRQEQPSTSRPRPGVSARPSWKPAT